MAQNNDTIELMRAVNNVRAGLTVLIDECYQRGRPELSEPFAAMLALLASADFETLRQLDAQAQ